MSTYAYIRVSTAEQNESRQLVTMTAAGVPIPNIYIDKASGKDLDRPAWHALMAALQPGDRLLIDSLDRLGRNYDDVTREWRRLTRDMGVSVKALDLDFFDSDSFAAMGDMGRCVEDMLLSLMAYMAASERDKMLRRQAEGIAVAKAEGRYHGGIKHQFDPAAIAAANSALASGRGGKAEAARILGVHRNTIDNMLKDGRLAA